MEDEILLNSLKEKSEDCIVNDRRKGADFLLTLINIFSFCVWGILLLIMSVCDGAGIDFFEYNAISLENINLDFVHIAINISAGLFIVSCIFILLSFKRCRRRSDKLKASIFIGEILSFFIWMLLVIKIYY